MVTTLTMALTTHSFARSPRIEALDAKLGERRITVTHEEFASEDDRDASASLNGQGGMFVVIEFLESYS